MTIKDKSIPIYKQIMMNIEYDIASGRLNAGDRLLSIRELALHYKVNPNTMQRALNELELEKLIITDRTNGKYVVKDENRLKILKRDLITEETQSYIKKAKKLRLNKDDTIEMLNKLWEESYE